MEIRDVETGQFVRLEPVSYQFPELVGVEYDSDWLIIRGRARSKEEEWTFQYPSLLVDEALQFGSWMREAAGGTAPILEPDEDGYTWTFSSISRRSKNLSVGPPTSGTLR